MGWEPARIHAPALRGDDWLNGDPVTLDDLLTRGPVLLDFWESSCVNCLRTLPYLVAWHERYAPHGLTIVGIHTPEFDFTHDPDAVAAAIRRHAIPYPVLLDNALENWSAYAIRAWPSKLLVDREGIIRYRATGEGHYRESEAAIQTLLRERHGAGLELPPLLEPLRPTDASGAVCYRTTPELHAGFQREFLGNAEPLLLDEPQRFAPVERLEPDRIYLEGEWRGASDYAESVSDEARVRLVYRAAELNVVAGSAADALLVTVMQDGEPLDEWDAGDDVVVDSELGSYFRAGAPRMHTLVVNPDFGEHELTLEARAPGLRVYAFSFATCLGRGDDGTFAMP